MKVKWKQSVKCVPVIVLQAESVELNPSQFSTHAEIKGDFQTPPLLWICIWNHSSVDFHISFFLHKIAWQIDTFFVFLLLFQWYNWQWSLCFVQVSYHRYLHIQILSEWLYAYDSPWRLVWWEICWILCHQTPWRTSSLLYYTRTFLSNFVFECCLFFIVNHTCCKSICSTSISSNLITAAPSVNRYFIVDNHRVQSVLCDSRFCCAKTFKNRNKRNQEKIYIMQYPYSLHFVWFEANAVFQTCNLAIFV